MRLSLWLGVMVVVGLGLAAPARAATLRMGALAPAGTAWARELLAFARDVEQQTAGALKVKWYLGGIAGDERTMLDRTTRGQLDGVAGTAFCELVTPSWRALGGVGLFRSRAETMYVMRHLAPRFVQESTKSGYVLLGWGGFGQDVIFSRLPFHSFDELRKIRLWAWGDSVMARAQYPRLGLEVTPADLASAAGLYDTHKIDGFVALPSAALAYQLSARARYFAALPLDQLEGCLVLAGRSMNKLPLDQQNALRSAAAKFSERFELTSQQLDDAMIDGLLQHQGLRRVTLSPEFLRDFDSAAKVARGALDDRVVNPSLIHEIEALVGEYRRAH